MIATETIHARSRSTPCQEFDLKVLFAGNNWLGWKALSHLRDRGEEIVGIALHPEARRRFGPEILAASGLSEDRILPGNSLNAPATLERVRALGADVAVSVLFDYILREPFLASFPKGVVNLHPSLLPWNRGQYPNVWSIIEDTPSGVTFHYIDPGIDTGDIIAQKTVEVEPVDTGETLYRKLERAGLDLFKEAWGPFSLGEAPRIPQAGRESTSHRTSDVEKVDEIDLDGTYTGRALLDVLRARTFPPYKGAWFRAGGRKVYVRVQLEYGEEGGAG
jgi:methionyl-tRNA formyltransferase